nr:hypothetical protein [uncultured Eisenbergiella sp.]
MIYLSQFSFPHVEAEYNFLMSQQRTCYDTYYPFQTISKHRLVMLFPDSDAVRELFPWSPSIPTECKTNIEKYLILK